MCYSKDTIELLLMLEVDNLQMIHLWVNTAFVLPPDIKIRGGGIMKMGRGNFIEMSKKKKINTRRSMGVYLISV